MTKSSSSTSERDTLTKTCAEYLGVSKKSLKKAVKEATVRRIAEKIADEHSDALWQEINGRSGQAKAKKSG